MHRLSGVLGLIVGLAVPLGLCLLWVPIRSAFPNIDLALILVLTTLVVGTLGRRLAVLVSATSAAFSFEFFDTRPFGHVAIASSVDIETTVALVVVSVVGGDLAVRVVGHRARARSESVRVTSIGETASLLASGEELVIVIQSVAERLRSLLDLDECTFLAGPGDDTLPALERNGEVAPGRGMTRPQPAPATWVAVLPVWGHAQVLGHYVLELAPGARPPGRQDLNAAITLADQVGAAFMTQAPPPESARQPAPGLHVVR
jgi:K+-sensing histidine kinase KdpD